MLILRTLARLGPDSTATGSPCISNSEDVFQVEEGSLYPALQRMLIKGWMVGEWGQSANNRRARYYRLRAAGRKHLAIEISQFENVIQAVTRVIQPA